MTPLPAVSGSFVALFISRTPDPTSPAAHKKTSIILTTKSAPLRHHLSGSLHYAETRVRTRPSGSNGPCGAARLWGRAGYGRSWTNLCLLLEERKSYQPSWEGGRWRVRGQSVSIDFADSRKIAKHDKKLEFVGNSHLEQMS